MQVLFVPYVANPTVWDFNAIEKEVNELYLRLQVAQENAYRYEDEVYNALWVKHIGYAPDLSYYRNLVDSEMELAKDKLEYMQFEIKSITD